MWKRKAKPTRDQLLAAVPVRNPLVRETALAVRQDAALAVPVLRLTAPLRASRLRAYLSRGVREKSFDLDPLGAFVWRSTDGIRTVEGLIHGFAAAHQLPLRAAEVPVLAFLKTLTERNLVALRV